MGGHACGPMGLAAPRAWGAPQRWSSPRAGRRMGQVGLDPIPLPPPWRLLMPLVFPFLCGMCTCPAGPPCRTSLPRWFQRCFALCPWASLFSGTFPLPVLPRTQSYPHTLVPRTWEQQGTLVTGHLFPSADEAPRPGEGERLAQGHTVS